MSSFGRAPLKNFVEVYTEWSRFDEAKRALKSICHHANCGTALLLGTDALPGEPELCWQGDETQGPCLRIRQWRRIRFLERRLKFLAARLERQLRRRKCK